MAYVFRWIAWNEEHVSLHGVRPDEAEYVIEHAQRPYPQAVGDDKFLVLGQPAAGD